MKISSVQKEALSKTPLFLTQSEYNLNRIVWTDNHITKDFKRSTIESLIKKGLLEYKKSSNGMDELNHVILTQTAKELGYKETL